MTSLTIDNLKYSAMIGVGGIGAGSFFALNGDSTLGREESRGGHFLDRRDYCKLHIISHYVKILLGSEFDVMPVGKVGDDDTGKRLTGEMADAGLDMRYIGKSASAPTLFSFCFVYPDGSGGNMTTDDSACSEVNASYVMEAEPEFAKFEGQGIALAVPEVPIEARAVLLRVATKYQFFRVASFTSEEILDAIKSGMINDVDLLAINLDEAEAILDLGAGNMQPAETARAAIKKLSSINPKMLVSITAGASGSWSWDGETFAHVPKYNAKVQSTAGAGDAHLSGIIAGLTAGLSLAHAQELGALVAALSVTSPHTINNEIDRNSLRAFAEKSNAQLDDAVRALLEDQI